MKIVIPKVVVAVDLAGYAPELAGKSLHVWVNPSREKLQAYSARVLAIQTAEVEKAREVMFQEGPNAATPFPNRKGEKEPAPSALERTYQLVRRFLRVKQERRPEGLDLGLLGWYAEIWSQGPAETQWTVEELQTLEAQDPAFLGWMIAQTWQARSEHIERKKKL